MIDEPIRQEIMHRLRRAEQQHGVKILLAIESGSRAWGFASPNSDYDVRFIYMHEPEWYLSIDVEHRRDVIEYPIVDDIDLNGWDIRKALNLFAKSNPAFVEWIQSPITYIEAGQFRQNVLLLLPEIYQAEKGIYHYLNMAKTNYRGHLQSEMVSLKKYFYVFRALLAAHWLHQFRQAAPIEFNRLLVLLDNDQVRSEINRLLTLKQASPELGLAARIDCLNDYIEQQMHDIAKLVIETPPCAARMQRLNVLFQHSLADNALDFSPDASLHAPL